jgi:tRNA threonylcarbamoyladenosine biosynthesis protein TsaB
MRVLALDTTTAGGSTALVEETRVVAEMAGDPERSQAEQLPDALLRLLQSVGRSLADVDRFAVASGPGSFTGLRIGIATMQGLAFVTRRPIVPVSALDALAHLGARSAEPGSIVAAWMDARRREVFSAIYRVAEGDEFSRGRLVPIEAASVGEPATTLDRWSALAPFPAVFVGDGAVLYAEAIGRGARIVSAPALAPAVGLMAVQLARAGMDVAPGSVLPLYVRRPDAEIARDRQPVR